jgi:hypothetical protein
MTGSFHKKGRYSSYAPAAELPHPKLEPEVFVILTGFWLAPWKS